jgi:hypothetical protein
MKCPHARRVSHTGGAGEESPMRREPDSGEETGVRHPTPER